MCLKSGKTGDAVGRASWRSSMLGDPGTKKEKSNKKERKEGLWKLTLLMEIRKERGFPQQLEKSLAKDARLFHSSHRPNNKNNNPTSSEINLLRQKNGLDFGVHRSGRRPVSCQHMSELQRTVKLCRRFQRHYWE